MNIFKKVALFLVSLFNSMEAYYKKLATDLQEVIKKASGIIAIVNSNLQATPDIVFTIIQAKYPDVTKEQLTGYLNTINGAINTVSSIAVPDFDTALKNLQAFLSKFQGNAWVSVTQNAVGLLISLLAPSTPVQKLTIVLEYVYNNFIKGKVAA